MTTVSWALYWPDDPPAQEPALAGEAELRADLDRFRRVFSSPDEVEGTFVVTKPGEPPLVVHDLVWAAVQHLSFACIPDVLDQRREHTYLYTTSEDSVVVKPDGASVHLAGDDARVVDDAAVVLPLLYDAGRRFLGLLDDAGTDVAAGVAAHLEPYADEAAATLRRHGLL